MCPPLHHDCGKRFKKTHDSCEPLAGVLLPCQSQISYCSRAKYLTMLIVAPANIHLLNNVFAWFIVPFIAVGRF
jgi:hypothetical protein